MFSRRLPLDDAHSLKPSFCSSRQSMLEARFAAWPAAGVVCMRCGCDVSLSAAGRRRRSLLLQEAEPDERPLGSVNKGGDGGGGGLAACTEVVPVGHLFLPLRLSGPRHLGQIGSKQD